MFDNIRQADKLEIPAAFDRIIVCVPSKRHVKALQMVLGERISQEDPIGWEEFHANPEQYKDKTRLLFLESHSVGETIRKMPGKLTFLAQDVFVIVDGTKIMPLRDQTGRKWGDENTSSEVALARYFDVLATIPEDTNAS